MLDIVYLLTCITLVVLPLFIPLSIMRQNSYRIIESAKVIKSRVERVVVPIFITVICAIMERSLPFASCLILVAYSIGCLFYYIIRRKSKRKITAKTFRLVVCYFLLCIPVCAIVCIYERAFYLPLITFVVLCLSKILLLPYEKRNELKFEKRAKEKLKKIKPKIIAVTGSYGKTTFKNVLSHLLACKYKVCVSPKSYNTPQGVCITINNHLKDDDDVLILEMGARYKGDIKRLVNMVQPEYCVLTSIGNQHLATFKIEERLIKEKISIFDLVATYNFYNADCDLIPKTVPATACGRNGKYSYSNTIKTENGWVFDFNYKGKIESITCPIYADYIPQTLCLAFAVALELGVTIDELKNVQKR